MNDQMSLFFDHPLTIDEVMSAWNDTSDYMSRLKIAEKLNRAKSPALIAILQACVQLGYLQTRSTELPNHVFMFEYCVAALWQEVGDHGE